jgi:hypothetical protein
MSRAAAAKIGASLLARKVMREVKAKAGMPVWRDDDGRPISLMITRAGWEAIGVEKVVGVAPRTFRAGRPNADARVAALDGAARASRKRGMAQPAAVSSSQVPVRRSDSKQALVIDMLSAKAGTTLDALIDATGWLPHTTRAALTGLRKRGFSIERSRADGEASVYRIVASSAAAAATATGKAGGAATDSAAS